MTLILPKSVLIAPRRLVYFTSCFGAALLVMICTTAAFAQSDQPLSQAVSAGGKWTVSHSEDRMTGAKTDRFELPADNAQDSDDRARIILYCTDGKLKLADFRPDIRLGRPDWPGFWGQPQMRVRVRADNAHDDHSWNWVNGHFLAMDKGTTRELIGAQLLRIEFKTPRGPSIAEFSPAGLDLNLVEHSCGLKPKKP